MTARNGIAAVLFAVGILSFPMSSMAQPQYSGPSGLTPQTEEMKHPRIVAAIRQLQASYRELQAAPDDFGGNKAQAMTDLAQAIHSLKRALYYRLKMDDRALDQLLAY
jgi:hypothetical protein